MIYAQIHRHTLTRFHIERTHMIRTTTDNRRTRLRRQCNQHEMTNGSGTNVKMRQHKKRYTHTQTPNGTVERLVWNVFDYKYNDDVTDSICVCARTTTTESKMRSTAMKKATNQWIGSNIFRIFFRASSNELVFEAQSNARNRKYCVTSMQWTLTK